MMKTKKYLTCDINRRIDMSNASRQPYPKGRAAQLGPHPSAAVSALAGGCPAIGPEMLHLRAPGLSLPRSGTTTQAPSPVGDAKVSFTIKLSRRLVQRLRAYAASTGLTLSEIASRAFSAVLHRGGGRG